jgi:endonuclease/exonuclease/phosphatase family metal-dependent hydrolase
MKIIYLNTWGAKVREAMAKFLKEQSRDTDVFCFQETYDDMRQLARQQLPGYAELEKNKYVNDDDNFPQAIYVRKTIPLLSSGVILENEPGTGLGIYAEVRLADGRNLFVCNFHGMSRPVDKLDDPARLKQSQTLVEFFKDKPGLKIIGGDFNLFPETESIKMFAKDGYRDLIKEYGITTTRNQLAWAMYPDNKQYYSDYVFISPEVKIKNFSVLDIEISDHLPLILEVE